MRDCSRGDMHKSCSIAVSDQSNREDAGLKDGDSGKGILDATCCNIKCGLQRVSQDWFHLNKNMLSKIGAKTNCGSAGHAQILEKDGARPPHPTSDELTSLFNDLSTTGSKSVILSLVVPYSDQFVPKPVCENFPLVLTEHRNNVLFICSDIDIAVSEEQANAVEAATRGQASSKLWFQFHAGQITASKMKAACHTDPNQLVQSLIKSV